MCMLLAVAACDAGHAPQAPVARIADASVVADARATDAAMAPDAMLADAAVIAPASGPTAAFRSAVLRYASFTGRYVAGWGTVRLDAVHPIRFATLEVQDYTRGAYIFELAANRYIAVTFTVDGRTQGFQHGDGVMHPPSEVAWIDAPELAIDHTAGHHHGGE